MHLRHVIPVFVFVLLLAACQRPGEAVYQTEVLEIDGVERTYHIHFPPDFSEIDSAPLVLALHGGGGQGLKFDQSTAGTLIPAAEARGMVLVFPDGIDKQWCDGRTEHLNEGRDCTAIDDVAFIAAIIERMAHDYGIDPRRVYATGISNGGFMSIRLALDLTDKIAAVAPVTAQLSMALAEQTPPLPISIMIMNGTDDPIVPFDGGEVQLFEFGRGRGEILSTLDTVERFRRYNDCEAVPALVKLPDSEPDDGTAVQIESYTNCADDTEVILVRVVGGGHTWPGGQPYLSPKIVGVVSQEINASEMILDFFLEQARD